MEPGRQLVMEGELEEVAEDGTTQMASYWFLFNDMLLRTEEKRKGEKFKFTDRLSLRDVFFSVGISDQSTCLIILMITIISWITAKHMLWSCNTQVHQTHSVIVLRLARTARHIGCAHTQ